MKILPNTRNEEAPLEAEPLVVLRRPYNPANPLRKRTTELYVYEDAIEFHDRKFSGTVVHRIRYSDIAQVIARERFSNSSLTVETRGGDKIGVRRVHKKPVQKAKQLINERIERAAA